MEKTAAANFTITNLTKRNVLDIPFGVIKEKILGKKYAVSLVFIGPAKARALNQTYRRRNYPTNVLSFPLAKNYGEIFINLTQAIQESRQFGHSVSAQISFLFIHALLHLKGWRHGSKMESTERKFLKFFTTDGQKHHHRIRCRNSVDQTYRQRTKSRR